MPTHDTDLARAHRSARTRGLLRVAGYLVLLCSVLFLWTARAAYAEFERTVFELGEKLVGELGPSLVGEPQAVVLNGQPVFVGATTSPLNVRQVLDAFDGNCRAGSHDLRSLLGVGAGASLLQEPVHETWLRALDQARVLRVENETEGMLSCLAPNHQQPGAAGLVDGIRAFMESGDLSRLGDLRYVTVRKQPSGETQVIAAWTEGRFQLAAIFPDTGDVPGSDMVDVPRPPGSVRAVCATAPRRSFAYRLYESAQPADEVLAFYERTLARGGWSRVHTVDEPADAGDPLSIRAFTKSGRALGIGIDRDEQGTTQISLVDMGQVAHADALAAP